MKTTCGLLVLSYLIAVVVGQTIQVIPANATVGVGDNVTIICNSSSDAVGQALNINDRPANPASDGFIQIPDSDPQISTFIYQNVEREDNGIGFSCSFSVINTKTNQINVTVLFPPIISNDNSVVTNGSVGDQVTVIFTVDANPQVIANDISINRAGADNIDVNGDQVTVTFSNLMRSDAGDYVVTATNSEGSGNAAFNLNVFFGPNFLQVPTGTIYETVGANVILNCSVESNPPATVTFNTTAANTSNVAINPTTGIVTITNTVLGNTGDYTCAADITQNVNQTFSVRIGNVPDIVLTYGMISYNMSHIVIPYTITTPNTFGSIQQYTVSCPNCPAGYTMISFASPLPNPAALPLNMITCGTTYTINIIATNEFGSAVVASGSYTTDDCVTPTPSTSPTGDSIGLVGTTTTTAVLVVLMGIITAVFVN